MFFRQTGTPIYLLIEAEVLYVDDDFGRRYPASG